MRSRPSCREARSTDWLIEYSLDEYLTHATLVKKIIHSVEKATLKSNSLVMFKTAMCTHAKGITGRTWPVFKSSLDLMKP